MLLMLDNYDSFTYNLVQYLAELGEEVQVVRNDQVTIDEIDAMKPERLVVSPGPGTPSRAGISIAAMRHFVSRIPVLGVCLGHQSMNEAFGGRTIHARRIMHGKHIPDHIIIRPACSLNLKTLLSPLVIIRWSSMLKALPDCLEVTAWTLAADGSREEIMGIKHREYPAFGVQFHPESVLTAHGRPLLQNFLKMS